MAVETQVWVATIVEKLLPDNNFVNQSINDDIHVKGKTVHIPESGDMPGGEINREGESSVSRREDITNDYDIDEVTTNATLVKNVEEVEVSYDKRASVLAGHIAAQNLLGTNNIVYRWAKCTPAASIVKTSGEVRAASLVGATGNRRRITVSDILKVKEIFDDADVPDDGRCLLLPAAWHTSFIKDNLTDITKLEAAGTIALKEGRLDKIFGFQIYTRGKKNVLTVGADNAPKSPKSARVVTDCAAALAWQKDCVRQAKGDVQVYVQEKHPTLYGAVMSTGVRFGGRSVFSDGTGIALIVETA
jgi:hypothetical protein